ncbi:hypothetical protein CGCS363_v007401 [Colletotrichum siamense]|uniref:uncharacterized protein n=1 Tax=Colletotrichum siamense TaxID=690259 RepID=UPI0018730C3F|nr:uncharacterized protein CGCS363_v007401 [Colletotrichum siamense]KAF5501544.1 hypothetical protein CGCS363_v007401 [Colletotrichum siamense]
MVVASAFATILMAVAVAAAPHHSDLVARDCRTFTKDNRVAVLTCNIPTSYATPSCGNGQTMNVQSYTQLVTKPGDNNTTCRITYQCCTK